MIGYRSNTFLFAELLTLIESDRQTDGQTHKHSPTCFVHVCVNYLFYILYLIYLINVDIAKGLICARGIFFKNLISKFAVSHLATQFL